MRIGIAHHTSTKTPLSQRGFFITQTYLPMPFDWPRYYEKPDTLDIPWLRYGRVLPQRAIEKSILNQWMPPLPENIEALVQALTPIFRSFDEYRVVWHKWDHAHNLQSRWLVPRIDLLHVDRTLGVNWKHYPLPVGGGETYEWLLRSINPAMKEEVDRIVRERRKVLVLMPFPNLGLEEYIAELWAQEFFKLGSSVQWEQFMHIEDKIEFANMVDQIDIPHRIPRKQVWPEDGFDDFHRYFGSSPGHELYFQKKLSWGGDGTRIVRSEQDFQQVRRDRAADIELQQVKATRGITNNDGWPSYPMNGTWCIIPDGRGGISIYLDHPSHKPVWLEALWGKPGSGNWNDWTSRIPEHIMEQYTSTAQQVGAYLHTQYNYRWLYGPDGLRTQDGYFINEVNPRAQGTTPYQTLNAIRNKRIPIELLHYIALFAEEHPELLAHLPNPESYNEQVAQETGGFYVKLWVSEEFQIQRDISWPWIVDNETGQISPVDLNIKSLITPEMVYLQKSGIKQVQDYLDQHNLIRVKCPKQWSTVTPGPTPFGYIMGSRMNVFETHTPQATPHAIALYHNIIRLIKWTQHA